MGNISDLERLWREMSKKQKEALLKARGLHLSWAKTKTIKEMVRRGGGLVANDLLRLVRTWRKRNPKVRIKFKKR